MSGEEVEGGKQHQQRQQDGGACAVDVLDVFAEAEETNKETDLAIKISEQGC